MLKIIFAALVLLHGLIHLMGFAKAFKLAQISQLVQPISKPVGAIWGLAAVLFLVAAVLVFIKTESWWCWAIPALVLSQILIFTNWQDAKFGTVANIIVAVGIVTGYGNWNLKKLVTSELQPFLTHQKTDSSPISDDKIAALPPIVQTWLRRSNVVGKAPIGKVHLHQIGEMRTTPEGKWMLVKAEQWFTVTPPGFLWLADVHMMPMVRLVGRDKYVDGHGHMLIKAASLLPVADSKGMEIDQGSMLRFLGETVWFPSAAVESFITWEEIDATSARATMTYGDMIASGIFRFTPEGDMLSFEANRYYERNGNSTLEPWLIETKAWKVFGGVRIPAVFEVTWKLKEGDFTWYKLEITDLNYDE